MRPAAPFTAPNIFGNNDMSHLLAAATEARTPPKPEALSGAPILRRWLPVLDPGAAPCLVGTVSGHPRLGDGKRIHTSMLLALDPDGAWARTRNRWYRLEDAWPDDIEPDEFRSLWFTCIRIEDAVRLAAALRVTILNCRGGHFHG